MKGDQEKKVESFEEIVEFASNQDQDHQQAFQDFIKEHFHSKVVKQIKSKSPLELRQEYLRRSEKYKKANQPVNFDQKKLKKKIVLWYLAWYMFKQGLNPKEFLKQVKNLKGRYNALWQGIAQVFWGIDRDYLAGQLNYIVLDHKIQKWSKEDQQKLIQFVADHSSHTVDWYAAAKLFDQKRTPNQCRYKYRLIKESYLMWDREQDLRLLDFVANNNSDFMVHASNQSVIGKTSVVYRQRFDTLMNRITWKIDQAQMIAAAKALIYVYPYDRYPQLTKQTVLGPKRFQAKDKVRKSLEKIKRQEQDKQGLKRQSDLNIQWDESQQKSSNQFKPPNNPLGRMVVQQSGIRRITRSTAKGSLQKRPEAAPQQARKGPTQQQLQEKNQRQKKRKANEAHPIQEKKKKGQTQARKTLDKKLQQPPQQWKQWKQQFISNNQQHQKPWLSKPQQCKQKRGKMEDLKKDYTVSEFKQEPIEQADLKKKEVKSQLNMKKSQRREGPSQKQGERGQGQEKDRKDHQQNSEEDRKK